MKYLVYGSAGEYSDRNTWPVRIYSSKKKAQEIVEELTELWQKLSLVFDILDSRCHTYRGHSEKLYCKEVEARLKLSKRLEETEPIFEMKDLLRFVELDFNATANGLSHYYHTPSWSIVTVQEETELTNYSQDRESF